MRLVPDPDHEQWVVRMRERARLDADELLARPPFEVFGLAEPVLRPAALAETGRTGGEWQMIALAYGDWQTRRARSSGLPARWCAPALPARMLKRTWPG
jgi:hypothetical protein